MFIFPMFQDSIPHEISTPTTFAINLSPTCIVNPITEPVPDVAPAEPPVPSRPPQQPNVPIPSIPFVPPVLPSLLFNWNYRPEVKQPQKEVPYEIPKKKKKGYTPSFEAISYGEYGPVTEKDIYSGNELRPIPSEFIKNPKGFSIADTNVKW